jgi:hypothetical protein
MGCSLNGVLIGGVLTEWGCSLNGGCSLSWVITDKGVEMPFKGSHCYTPNFKNIYFPEKQ